MLHDYFCLNGLDVATKSGDTPFKIYGDNAMLGRESAKGVKYSAQTSRMSRDAIYELGTTGETAHTTQTIAGRFPTYVRPKRLERQPLARRLARRERRASQVLLRHGLRQRGCDVLEELRGGESASSPTQVSKDAVPDVHSGEGF